MVNEVSSFNNIPWDTDLLYNDQKLEWIARSVSQSVRHGKHSSQNLGFNSEFKQYGHFKDGDDSRYLDWKVFARSKKKYSRQYHSETTTQVVFLIDNNLSMKFASSPSTPSKFQAAQIIAAILSRLFCNQQDSIRIMTRTPEESENQAPPPKSSNNFGYILTQIQKLECIENNNFIEFIGNSLDRIKKNTLVFILSDFLFDLPVLNRTTRNLVSITKNLQFLQILDPLERSLDLPEYAVLQSCEFDNLHFSYKAKEHKTLYLEKFHQHQDQLAHIMKESNCPYTSIDTAQPLHQVMTKIIR